MFTLMLTINM